MWSSSLYGFERHLNRHEAKHVRGVRNERHSSQLCRGVNVSERAALVLAHQNDLNLGDLPQCNVQSYNAHVVASTLLVWFCLFVCLFVPQLMLVQHVRLAFEPGEVSHLVDISQPVASSPSATTETNQVHFAQF